MSPALFDGAAASYDAWYETEVGRAVDEVEERLVGDRVRAIEARREGVPAFLVARWRALRG